MKFFWGPVSPNFCARRSVMMILNLSESLAKPLVIIRLSPSRVLRAPGTSSYHLVPKHLRATWPRPEQSHLFPEACSPNGTDNRQQRQRRTKRPPPEPSDILKRFHALYDNKLRYYMKKVSKLYCYYNPLRDMGHIRPIAFSSNFQKNLSVKGLIKHSIRLIRNCTLKMVI